MFIRHRLRSADSPKLLFVPTDLHRVYGRRDLHFLTFSCYQRQPLFSSPARCDLFLETLERMRRRYRFVVLAYVVMPEHIHLLVTEPQRETLSTVIQALKLGFVRSLEGGGVVGAVPRSRKGGETWGTPCFLGAGSGIQSSGSPASSLAPASSSTSISGSPIPHRTSAADPHRFWQARFYDFNVWTERKRIEKLRYIHRNPVTRGLVASPEQWPWSSFRWYWCGEKGPVKINDTDILVMTVRPRTA